MLGELYVSFFERTAEAADAIAVLANIFALGFVEDVADVGACVAAGFDEGDEIFDQLFEEDVVFPEGVVGVDEKGVSAHGDSCSATLWNLKIIRALLQRYVSLPVSERLRR